MHTIVCGDSQKVLTTLPDASVTLTVTSPPYDDLRTYAGHSFDFQTIAQQLLRVTKPGGTVVWIVADATKNGSETGTSFRQALFFKDIGFSLHDTMIWNKGGFTATGTLKVRYGSVFEYMFVLTKGKLTTFNPIKDRKNKTAGLKLHGSVRQKDGGFKPMCNAGKVIPEFGQRFNVWDIPPEMSNVVRSSHPAPFPEKLVEGHILSWSNSGDLVLDPFMGSGTTGKVAVEHGREFIGIDACSEYCDISRQRISNLGAHV